MAHDHAKFKVTQPAGWAMKIGSKAHWYPANSSVSICERVTNKDSPRHADDRVFQDTCGLCRKLKPSS